MIAQLKAMPSVLPAGDRPATVMVVDDSPLNLRLLDHVLRQHVRVRLAAGGEEALALAAGEAAPDLILLDVSMPDIDGYEVCRRLKADPATAHIPVIFLTANNDEDEERKGLELGAVDYVTKPFSPPLVLARVRNQLRLKQANDLLRGQNSLLEAEVRRRTAEIQETQDALLVAMASLAETRDNETANHIHRTQEYVRILATGLRDAGTGWLLDDDYLEMLYKAAPLHDIGKVGIPDRILLKQGRLTPQEFDVMKEHTRLGHDAILSVERSLSPGAAPFLNIAREIAISHHERWDGKGYPAGLKGTEIPLPGRLMAVADVYDALVSRRSYKPALSHDVATRMIVQDRGSHFDPALVDIFLLKDDEFRRVAAEYADGSLHHAPPSPEIDPHLFLNSGEERSRGQQL